MERQPEAKMKLQLTAVGCGYEGTAGSVPPSIRSRCLTPVMCRGEAGAVWPLPGRGRLGGREQRGEGPRTKSCRGGEGAGGGPALLGSEHGPRGSDPVPCFQFSFQGGGWGASLAERLVR